MGCLLAVMAGLFPRFVLFVFSRILLDVSHTAATPPGLTVTVEAEWVAVDGARLSFKVKAHDGVDAIGEGRHQRYVVRWEKFNERVAEKAKKLEAAS